MKSAGIIAEYNPFHNGHAHQIKTLKETYQADTIAVAISGSFIQRGAPAWTDKYLRTKMALEQGADFVFELPAVFALSSAESFASGGACLLAASGLISHLCFGSECGNINVLQDIADFLVHAASDTSPEYTAYNNTIHSLVKKGISYPRARQTALEKQFTQYLSQEPELLSSPNNILAIEYLKAIASYHLPLNPITLKRTDKGYHNTTIPNSGSFASASAIRNSYEQTGSLDSSSTALPPEVKELLCENKHYPVIADDFSDLVYYRLKQFQSPEELTVYPDITKELAQRIWNFLPNYKSFTQFTHLVKSKNITYNRISRSLFHILLELAPAEHFSSSRNPSLSRWQYAPYLRLLGIRRSKSSLLRQVTDVPVITKVADAQATLTAFYSSQEFSHPFTQETCLQYAWNCFQKDLLASGLYRQVANRKLECSIPDEFRAGPILIE